MGESIVFVLFVLVLAIGLPIFCFVRFAGFQTRLERLEADLENFERWARTGALGPAPSPGRSEATSLTSPVVAPPPGPAAVEEIAVPACEILPLQPTGISPVAAAFVPYQEIPESQPVPAGKEVLNWEMFAGGRLLNAVGAIVLVIGVGLFLKYAFDMNWITFAMRVAGGAVLGAGLLAFGEFCHRRGRERWFSQGIVAAGLGVLYVSGHAAFASYHLVPFAAAYGFMSLVTLTAFLLAVRYDALPVALLAWLGGFVTPFVLTDGIPNEIGFASYLVLLDLGMLAVAVVKARWLALEPLAFTASYFAAFAWYSRYEDASSWFVSAIALLSLWLVFFAVSVAQVLRTPKREFGLWQVLGALNAVFFWSFAAVVLAGHSDALQVVLAVAASAYAIAYALVLSRTPLARAERIQYYGTALAFLFGLTWLHFPNPFAGSVAIALEGLTLVAIDRLLRKRISIDSEEASIGAAVLLTLQCLAAVEVSTNPLVQSGWHFNFAFGARDLAVVVAGAAFLALQALTARRRVESGHVWLPPLLRLEAVLALAVFTACHFQGFALADAYALEAVALALIGTRGMLREIELAGLAMLAAAGIAAAVAPDAFYYQRIFSFDPLHNGRLLATGVLGAAAIVSGELFRRRSLMVPAVGRILRILGAAVAVAGVTLQVRDSFELARAFSAFEPSTAAAQAHTLGLGNLEQLAISGVWIAASLLLVGLGIGLRLRDLRLMAIALFDLTILKAFFFDLGSLEALYRIAAFIGLGSVLLVVSYIYQRLEQGTLRSDRADDSLAEPAGMSA